MRVHVSSLLRALEVNTRTAAAALAGEGRFLGRFHAARTRSSRASIRECRNEKSAAIFREVSLAALKPVAADQSHP